MEISSQNKEIILLAAWFHDTGHTGICGSRSNQSVTWRFLKGHSYEKNALQQIIDCFVTRKYLCVLYRETKQRVI
ncbi:MAG: hypothetical protein AAF734_03795 [Bacteroidota bacterium]